MKITVCDDCRKEKTMFFDKEGVQLCEECYYASDLHTKTELEENWGVKMAKKLAKFDAFLVFDYESFNYPKDDAEEAVVNIMEVFDKLGIKGIDIIPDSNEDYSIIGFKKV